MPPPGNLKRKRFNQPEEITFDFSARQDYLTGFHKRKLDRIKYAQDVAAKKEREAKLEARRQLRADRKAELERHVQIVNESMPGAEDSWQGGSDESEEEWTGIDKEVPADYEENYSDEDRNTTVVIEEVDITRERFQKVASTNDEEEEKTEAKPPVSSVDQSVKNSLDPAKKKRIWSKDAPKRDKQKKKKFRYETKAERKITRSKERSGGAKAKAKRKGYS